MDGRTDGCLSQVTDKSTRIAMPCLTFQGDVARSLPRSSRPFISKSSEGHTHKYPNPIDQKSKSGEVTLSGLGKIAKRSTSSVLPSWITRSLAYRKSGRDWRVSLREALVLMLANGGREGGHAFRDHDRHQREDGKTYLCQRERERERERETSSRRQKHG